MSFKIAVIGCGWVSNACHGPAYRKYAAENPDIELAACVDRDDSRAQDFRTQFGFKHAYTDYREMLDVEKPSVVCLNVNVNLTAQMGVDILNKGYPLLAEKPPGMTIMEIDRLIEAARAAHVFNMVAFNRRYMPLMVELKQMMSGCKVHHIEYQLARVGRVGEDFTATAIHAVDAVRFLAEADYQQVSIRYQESHRADGNISNYGLDGIFTSGVTTSIAIHPATGVNIERAVVHCRDHTFMLNANNGLDAPGSLKHYDKGKLVADLDGAEYSNSREDYILSGFYTEDAAFFDAIRAGTQIKDDIQSGRQPVEIMQAMREQRAEYILSGMDNTGGEPGKETS